MIAQILASKFGKWLVVGILLLGLILWKRKSIAAFFSNQLRFSKNRSVVGGGEVSKDWVRDELPALVKTLHDEITTIGGTSWFGTGRCDILGKILELNDNQLREIANSYRKFYKTPLLDDVIAIWEDGCFYKFRNTLLADRLKSLNIV